ncbi:MAG: hypothetical protein AMXMBFR7_40690 [Planctomycetota bacterium]
MSRFLCAAVLLAVCAGPAALRAGEPFTLTSMEQENKLGEETYQEILKKEKVSTDPEIVAYVKRVTERITKAAPDKGFKYEVAVLESPNINAFCLPGGKMCVYTAILPFCENEAGLATVMGHEVAHAILRHGGQRMTQGMMVDMVGVGLDVFLKTAKVEGMTGDIARGAYGYGAQLGILLPYSRSHETQSDQQGLVYLAKAGYDPSEAPAFWQRFSVLKSDTPSFLSTHPAHDDRIARLTADQGTAMQIYAASPKLGKGEPIPARYMKIDAKTGAPIGTPSQRVGSTSIPPVSPPNVQVPGATPPEVVKPPVPVSAPSTPASTTPPASNPVVTLAEKEIRAGLQEALASGMKSALAKLGRTDGYFKDAAVKVLLPEKLKDLDRMARLMGKSAMADDFVLQMNRAAEQAAPATAEVLATAIAQLNWTDARAILDGKADEATQYFARTCDEQLQAKILPLVQQATAAAGATQTYKDLLKRGGFLAQALVGDFNLDAYVTRKAVDGLYLKIADEERAIRANPAAQASDLLRKVFGAAKK